jgi:tetratricopeptide (TPR) repeat protein
LQLDPDIGQAYDTLGLMKWRFDRDWAGAGQEFNRAIALTPSYECAHADYALYLGFTGRRAEALVQITKSRELNPGTSFDSTEAGVYYLLRDYKSLTEAGKKGVAADPNDWLVHFFLGTGYEGSGNPAKAIPEYQKAIQLSGGDNDSTAALAHAYAVTGKKAEAEKILRDLQQKSKTTYVSPYLLATIYAGLGEKDSAFRLLEEAYHERALEITWAFKSDLRIDNLRSDPRFQSLLQRIAFPAG